MSLLGDSGHPGCRGSLLADLGGHRGAGSGGPDAGLGVFNPLPTGCGSISAAITGGVSRGWGAACDTRGDCAWESSAPHVPQARPLGWVALGSARGSPGPIDPWGSRPPLCPDPAGSLLGAGTGRVAESPGAQTQRRRTGSSRGPPRPRAAATARGEQSRESPLLGSNRDPGPAPPEGAGAGPIGRGGALREGGSPSTRIAELRLRRVRGRGRRGGAGPMGAGRGLSPPLCCPLQVVTNRDTQETLLCIAYVFEVSASEHGAQHHIYRLVKE